MAAELRINHTNRAAANVASLLDDDLTSDVVFVISEEVGADTRGSSHATTLQRLDTDIGPSPLAFRRRRRRPREPSALAHRPPLSPVRPLSARAA